jgi:hypothetical protein
MEAGTNGMYGRVVRLVVLLAIFGLLIAGVPAAAQGAPLVAFANASGQLVVSSGDGAYRWIITNPGERLAGDYAWVGSRLVFAVDAGGSASLRAADASSQSVTEIGQVAGVLRSLSPDGSVALVQGSDGSYALQSINGDRVALPVSNNPGAPNSGLWSNAQPLVAYWGYAGNSTLAVTSATSGQTITLDSGRSAPITPLAWIPGSALLIYRDTSGIARLSDVSCLQSGCAANPLESGIALANADTDAATDGTWLYFRSGTTIAAVNLGCASSDTCLNSSAVIAQNAAPQTTLQVGGRVLAFTGFAANPNDSSDREVRALSLGCMNDPASCAPQTILGGAVAGAVSANGRFVVIESGSGLESLDLSSGQRAYLSDRGAALAGARWQS